MRGGADPPEAPERGVDHRCGHSDEQQRRDDQRQEQVLDHVGAEQVRVAEIVEGPVQGEQKHDERGPERAPLAPRGPRRTPGARCVYAGDQGNTRHHVGVPGAREERVHRPKTRNWPLSVVRAMARAMAMTSPPTKTTQSARES